VHAIRFQSEIFNWFDQKGDLRGAVKNALPCLSEWHVKVLRRLRSAVQAEALRKFVFRITKFWPIEPDLGDFDFRGLSDEVANALRLNTWAEYPQAARFYAMIEDALYPIMISGADLGLMWIVTKGHQELPPVDTLVNHAFYLTFATASHNDVVYRREYTAPAASAEMRLKYAQYKAEAMDNAVIALREHPDDQLAQYGLRVAIHESQQIKDTHEELRNRVLAVDLVVADIARTGEVLDRISLKMAELQPLADTIDDANDLLTKLWEQTEAATRLSDPLSQALVKEGFEIYRDGHLRRHEFATELWPQLLETDLSLRYAGTSHILRTALEQAIAQNQPWLMKTTGESLVGWSRIGSALAGIAPLLDGAEVAQALPPALKELFLLVLERLNALADDTISFRREHTEPMRALATLLEMNELCTW
jgi:hypothetical protein